MATKEELEKEIESLKAEVEMLKMRKEGGQKGIIKRILRREDRVTINEIATEMKITSRNVSTLLNYCKGDGWEFGKDSKKRLIIEKEGK